MNQSLLYDTHRDAGALLRPSQESTPLLTYGSVPEEHAAAHSGVVLFDRTDRGLLRVRGAAAANFLHRLLSNEVEGLESGEGNRNLLLSGKGKVLFDFDLCRDDTGFLLSTSPGQAAGLLQALDMYLFAEDVQLEDISEQHAPLLISGPACEALARELGTPLPSVDHHWHEQAFGEGSLRVKRLAPFGPAGYSIDAGPALAPALWSHLRAGGARPTGRVVSDSLRVSACRALAGEDIDDNIYPQEARLEEAFSLSKGCYIGQEVVAKIDTYGGVNKRLCRLRVSHSDPVPRGSRLLRFSDETNEWRDLGMVTSWAYSFEHDTGAVLAYIKRRHQAAHTVFRIEAGPGEATLLE